jgi:hypothetical protein
MSDGMCWLDGRGIFRSSMASTADLSSGRPRRKQAKPQRKNGKMQPLPVLGVILPFLFFYKHPLFTGLLAPWSVLTGTPSLTVTFPYYPTSGLITNKLSLSLKKVKITTEYGFSVMFGVFKPLGSQLRIPKWQHYLYSSREEFCSIKSPVIGHIIILSWEKYCRWGLKKPLAFKASN